jgi:sarcosine oxidase, subunit alpha
MLDAASGPGAHSDPRGRPVQVLLDGKPVRAFSGESVAVGLYASGHRVLSRSIKYHRPRSFFCLEGHCGACLMRIDGVPNLRACMEPCRDGLTAEAQNAYPAADLDVLEAVDWLFPGGMNHHTLMTGSAVLNQMANKVVRKLSGLGRLPDRRPAEQPGAEHLAPDILVIGGGPAGLAAATAAARAGARAVLLDEHDRPGGSLLADPRHGPADAARRAAAARSAGATLLAGATAIAYYPEDPEPALIAATAGRMYRITPRRYIYATGGHAVSLPFANNDRPGVLAARAVGRMLVRDRVRPGDRVCVVGSGSYPIALGKALDEAGCEVIAVDGHGERITGVRGRSWVSSVELTGSAGRAARHDCDLVAVWAPPSPASEGPRQHGCPVTLRPDAGGFAVIADADGRTDVPGVLACGDVCGYMGPEEAARMGERTGRIAAEELS